MNNVNQSSEGAPFYEFFTSLLESPPPLPPLD